MKKHSCLSGELLIQLFNRMVEASGKADTKDSTVCPSDPTHCRKHKVFAELEYGLTGPELFIGPPTKEDFDEFCYFAQFPEQLGPYPSQILQIDIQSIWGSDITVTDYETGKVLMSCYYDGDFSPRHTLLKPQDTLRNLLWNADFINQREADRILACWAAGDDEDMEDPYGSLSDYI